MNESREINMEQQNYDIEQAEAGVPIKMWTRGVPVEPAAKQQLANAEIGRASCRERVFQPV
jgi:hypothetical protein